MKVLFLHGTGADPNGIRPTFLKEEGFDVIHPALPDGDFDESVRIGLEAFDREMPDVVVGSSNLRARASSAATPLVLSFAPGVPITVS